MKFKVILIFIFSIFEICHCFYDEIYTCKDGSTSKSRILIISPQEQFMYQRFLQNVLSRAPLGSEVKSLGHLTTITGFIQGHKQCLTVIETPQIFGYLDVIDAIDEISTRCFSKILISIDISDEKSPLTSRQSEMLVAMLKLMESIYESDIWEKLDVIFWKKNYKGCSVKSERCLFPFQHGGESYSTCIELTPIENEGHAMDKKYYCKIDNAEKEMYGLCNSNCTDDDGNPILFQVDEGISVFCKNKEEACVFPFKHEGIEYNYCISNDGTNSGWCATEVDADGNVVEGRWGLCSSECPVPLILTFSVDDVDVDGGGGGVPEYETDDKEVPEYETDDKEGSSKDNHRSWFVENIEIPSRGERSSKNLRFHHFDSTASTLLINQLKEETNDDDELQISDTNFLTKAGHPWFGEPAALQVNHLSDDLTLTAYIQVDKFYLEKLEVLHNNVLLHNIPISVLTRRNDMFQVHINVTNMIGTFQLKYNGNFSINNVDVSLNPEISLWSKWSEWSKCLNINENVKRRRMRPSMTEEEMEVTEFESRRCYCSDLKDYPLPRILMIGKTGMGKSTLGNQLLGGHRAFASGHGIESKTEDIAIFTGNFLGVGQCFTIIDTPGAKDTKGRDYKLTLVMQKVLKNKIKSFEVILLLTSGQNPRVDGSTIDLLKWYEAVFGQEMWKHVIIEVTFWGHKSGEDKKRRSKRKTNEDKFASELRSKIKFEMNITEEIHLPVLFLDPVANIFEDPCKGDEIEEREKDKFTLYAERLREYIKNIPPYDCKVRCLAPDEFFGGGPFVSIPSSRVLNIKKGEKKWIEWQIWSGVISNRSTVYDIYVDDTIIYQKLDGMISPTASINESSAFAGFMTTIVESNKIPKVTSVRLSIELETNSSSEVLNFTADLKNDVESPSSVHVLVARDAILSEWTPWTDCSVSCIEDSNTDEGQQSRSQSCEPEINDGESCAELLKLPEISPNMPGVKVETRSCFGGENQTIIFCPIGMTWSNWTSWSDCIPGCGIGNQTRTRACTDGRYGGPLCSQEHEMELEECQNPKECPIDCTIGEWSIWSDCSMSCNPQGSNEISTRQRKKPVIQESNTEGVSCQTMKLEEVENCKVPTCPVDGVWSSFSEPSHCSVSCGEGIEISYRQCIGPFHNGKPCEGDTRKKESCNKRDCPIDCVYSTWGSWSSCSKTCGSGSKTRERVKTDPSFGGRECNEKTSETIDCYLSQCPIAGFCQTLPYKKDNGKRACGFHLNEGLNFYSAKSQCESRGARLPDIRSSSENGVIQHYKTPTDMCTSCELRGIWLGMTDSASEGSFRLLSDGSGVPYSKWYPGEPNNAGDEDCVIMIHNEGKWNDANCNSGVQSTMCEYILPDE